MLSVLPLSADGLLGVEWMEENGKESSGGKNEDTGEPKTGKDAGRRGEYSGGG
jgi:hypothetical protein